MGLLSLNMMAQDTPKEEGFVFTTVKENPITSVKNQNRSSTCWSFSSIGFLESELLRMGKGEYDLSEMFVVHHTIPGASDSRSDPASIRESYSKPSRLETVGRMSTCPQGLSTTTGSSIPAAHRIRALR